MSKEVEIQYDFMAYDAIEKIKELLEERNLKFEERWIDTSLYLKIVEVINER